MFEIKVFSRFSPNTMVYENTMVFYARGVWLLIQKLCFEYHGLLDTIVFWEYLKLHSNSKFAWLG